MYTHTPMYIFAAEASLMKTGGTVTGFLPLKM
jgi:hypothetical protein